MMTTAKLNKSYYKQNRKYSDSDGDESTGFDMSYLINGSSNPYSKLSQNTSSNKTLSVETFEKRIKPSDTLTNLSLKYECKLSLLKKVNNLYNDQEFYALKVIKIPYQKHGQMSEKFAHEIEGGLSPSPTDSLIDISSSLISSRLRNDEDDTEVDNGDETRSKISQEFFSKMDADIQHNILKTTKKMSTSIIDRNGLTSYQIIRKSEESSMHWCYLLMLVVCIMVLTPCLYLLYFEYLPWKLSNSSSLPSKDLSRINGS